MGIFLQLLAVLKAALPLPVWTDQTAVAAWLRGLEEPLSVLISTLMGQWQTTGTVLIDLPTGACVALVDPGDGKPTMSSYHVDQLATAVAEALPAMDAKGWRDWIDLLVKYLPLILEIFGIFFKPSPTPVPPPGPITV
jgi:hypothetical protein